MQLKVEQIKQRQKITFATRCNVNVLVFFFNLVLFFILTWNWDEFFNFHRWIGWRRSLGMRRTFTRHWRELWIGLWELCLVFLLISLPMLVKSLPFLFYLFIYETLIQTPEHDIDIDDYLMKLNNWM
jgi:hypothetical protein